MIRSDLYAHARPPIMGGAALNILIYINMIRSDHHFFMNIFFFINYIILLFLEIHPHARACA